MILIKCEEFVCVMMIVGQEVLANEKAQSSKHVNEEVDLDELMDVSAILSYFLRILKLLSLNCMIGYILCSCSLGSRAGKIAR